jgi:hypothetical protein
VRITTRNNPEIPSVVTPGPGDPLRDFVLCDEVRPLWEDEIRAGAGALSRAPRGLSNPASTMPSG